MAIFLPACSRAEIRGEGFGFLRVVGDHAEYAVGIFLGQFDRGHRRHELDDAGLGINRGGIHHDDRAGRTDHEADLALDMAPGDGRSHPGIAAVVGCDRRDRNAEKPAGLVHLVDGDFGGLHGQPPECAGGAAQRRCDPQRHLSGGALGRAGLGRCKRHGHGKDAAQRKRGDDRTARFHRSFLVRPG